MDYQFVNDRVIHNDGRVAVSYFTTIQHIVKVQTTNYVFVPQRNVCMAWVQPEHLGTMLSLTKECCGGKHSAPAYRFTSIDNVRIWTGDAER